MKFGRDFHLLQVPEWASFYVNYNGLKRRIKQTFGNGKTKEQSISLGQELIHEINLIAERIEQFYSQKYDTLEIKMNSYRYILNPSNKVDWTRVDPKELQYFFNIVNELRKNLQKLFYFGKLNADAFRKIINRLHRSMGEENASIGSRSEPQFYDARFYSPGVCWSDLEHLENLLADISLKIPTTHPGSNHYSVLLQKLIAKHSVLGFSVVAYRAIREDNDYTLDQCLGVIYSSYTSGEVLRSLITTLLPISISWGSSSCLTKLLSRAEDGADDTYDSGHSIHLLIIEVIERIGLEGVSAGTRTQQSGIDEATSDDDLPISLLKQTLNWLTPRRQSVLYSSDSFKRLALHYAAEYGHIEACQALLDKMRGFESYRSDYNPLILMPDSEGNAPLELAVYGGHIAAAEILLGFHTDINSNIKTADDARLKSILANLLIIALKSGHQGTVDLLLAAGADVNSQGTSGESALYVAARRGNLDIVNLLLDHGSHLDDAETAKGWTPLLIAVVEGSMAIVKALLEAGANHKKCDLIGWTALDHAAYRGNIQITKMLRKHGDNGSTTHVGDNLHHTLIPHRRKPPAHLSTSSQSRILVTLGSFTTSKDVIAVDLDDNSTTGGLSASSGASLTMAISAQGASGFNDYLDLTQLKNVTNHLLLFTAEDPSTVKLGFGIYRTFSKQLVGGGIAILGELQKGLGPNRESLIREYKIPILSKHSLEYLGTVTFNLLIVTPFEHVAQSLPARDSLWGEAGPTKVVGHRGRGMNVSAHDRLQIGENSIQSFLSAFELGAAWVELDVQVTNDHVPVVYHDFLASETGTDAWIHNLNLNQFMHISKTQSQPLQPPAERSAGLRPRARSEGAEDDHRITDLNARFQNTYEYLFKQFKSNTRGDYIHDPFITLDELLVTLPGTYPLNIEIKYPMLFEARDQFKADIFSIEINLFVNTILRHIFDQPRNRSRPIMFSSFSPEICILLSLKQDKYPIFFLTDAGDWPTGDIRTGSLQDAVHFAKRWHLDGVVTASAPLVMAPKLVRHVKSKGLVTASYGKFNNDPVSAKVQADAGLDIIIVDNVRLIVETLNGAMEH